MKLPLYWEKEKEKRISSSPCNPAQNDRAHAMTQPTNSTKQVLEREEKAGYQPIANPLT